MKNVTPFTYLHKGYDIVQWVESDRWAGARENRGREGYGRREERGREAGFPKWWAPGKKKENFAILRNILQDKKNKEAGTPTEGGGRWE